ncbi:hypothetical protein CHLRE_02g141246v5 [Chlamydomonas reinhardtii]|uniref:Uncharacterized protein n=1 Tax=Chlamydomonas reinhardtii TaxID=3055 RepID=A0A2K3E465_CHLRE|nr:uncharacterized protein CHLRE_02g141246v5 [Chlamydomonas reinhardtii]PNW87590.1 hypothetical protein CHLRE_02g141246v5 [Chlamydomonas reinhardtii]
MVGAPVVIGSGGGAAVSLPGCEDELSPLQYFALMFGHLKNLIGAELTGLGLTWDDACVAITTPARWFAHDHEVGVATRPRPDFFA